MQGAAGNIVPPREFLPAMKSIAEEVDALFIADEMITGLGRTGTWWGVHHTGVAPDIVTIGEAAGGGFPLSALATGIELVSDKETKTPLTRKVTERIFGECVRRGLLAMSYASSVWIQPPLTTDEATAQNGLAILGEVFDLVAREGWWRA
jgi:4-aminobutyrate aminotransferase-like enzyme